MEWPFGEGITPARGLMITMDINHVSKSWDDPPSRGVFAYPPQNEQIPQKLEPAPT